MGVTWGERRTTGRGLPALPQEPAAPAPWPRTTRSRCAAMVEADLPVLIRRREALLTELQELNEAITDCLTLQLATMVGPRRRMRRHDDPDPAAAMGEDPATLAAEEQD